MLFPLHLTPFEEYMLLDDQPAYPMSCFFMLKLQGQFNVAVFQSALQKTLENHPLLTCSAQEIKRKFFWINSDTAPTIVRLPMDVERRFPAAKGIDLFREPALNITICNDNTNPETVNLTGQTNIVFDVHHSACDAAGIVRFAEDVLYEYAQQRGFADAPREAVEPDLLPRRGKFGKSRNNVLRMLPKQFWGLFRAWTFLMNRVVPLETEVPAKYNGVPAKYPAILHRDLTATETQEVQQEAKQLGMTLNDWFLCSTFSAMKNWQEQHAAGKQRGHLRIAVPTNLRTPSDVRMPAANIVSMVFLDRKPENIQPTETFYQGVHREMQHIKRCNLGWAFIQGLTLYRHVFGSFRKMMRPDRCWATATVTNLGRLFVDVPLPKREGRIQIDESLELTGVEASPPVRAHTAIGICVMTYADCITINLHYDSHVMIGADAQSLLEHIVSTP